MAQRLIVKEHESGNVTLAFTNGVNMKYFALLTAAIATGVILAKAVKTYTA